MTIRSILESGRIFFVIGVFLVVGGVALAMPPQKPGDATEADSATTAPTEGEAQSALAVSSTAEAVATTLPTTQTNEDKKEEPLVEVYIPSVTDLVAAARKSRTAAIGEAMGGVLHLPEDETGEGFDFTALVKLFEHVGTWPDTSIAFSVFPQNRDGRALWAAELDWPLDELRARVGELLEQDVAKEILEGIELKQTDNGVWQVELPDVVLGVLSARGEGSMIAASADVVPPDEIYGQEHAAKARKAKKSPRLVYAQMRGDNDASPIAQVPGIKDASYYLGVRRDGQWAEGLMVRWNMLVGTGAKILFQKTKKPFECPADSYLLAAYNFGAGEGLADAVAGFAPGVIGMRAGNSVGFSVVPGTGFFPLPDVYFQFRAHHKDRIIKSIREAIEEDWKDRKADDRDKAWFEQQVGDRTIFWHDPSVDSNYGLMPATYRTVIFFDGEEKKRSTEESEDAPSEEANESSSLRLIVAQTSTWAEDAVKNWDEKTGPGANVIELPSNKKADWQARVRWRAMYELLQPYLCLLTSSSEDVALPPPPEEISPLLSDSVLDLRIHYAGLQVRHRGPIPGGAVIVPALVGMSLTSAGDPSSEAARERTASRNLRVLHHHAELFKRDYGRWPATVAELDGYVDFASHPHLLYLRPRERNAGERILSAFVSRERREEDEDEEEAAIDDSLYEIEWATDSWKLKLRPGEFAHYETIYIDEDGEIHRVPKEGERSGEGTMQAAGATTTAEATPAL